MKKIIFFAFVLSVVTISLNAAEHKESCQSPADTQEQYVCQRCDGSGYENMTRKCQTFSGRGSYSKMRTCSACNGSGSRKERDKYGNNVSVSCSSCDGTGHIIDYHTCSSCNGTGETRMTCFSCHGTGYVNR